ncbi:MAG TPA: sigma-70 family RNA polymerase sigma factor [Polyangia bacterium]|nr:sigma-70 family RNA polymerase sigma factor [Polyangia bacterium]
MANWAPMPATAATFPTDAGEPSVADLVARAAAGDREAETILCRRFLHAVRTFARRRLRAADAVEEFTQDVLLVLIEALRRGAVEDPPRLGGFVLGICRNVAHDRVRQRERREALWQRYGTAWESLEDRMPAADEVPGYDIIHLEDCLSRLSQRARDVVRLAYAEAKSHREIAERLATSETNARVLRHRTLIALRGCISERMSWENGAA